MAERTGLEPATPGVTGRYSNQLNYRSKALAEWTGLEPATPGVTGRYSDQLNYHSVLNSGGRYWTRTSDLCRVKAALYQLRLTAQTIDNTKVLWRSGRDSNPRPPA